MTSEPRPPWGIYRSGFLSVILLVAGLLIYMWGHVQTLSQGREIDRLSEERKKSFEPARATSGTHSEFETEQSHSRYCRSRIGHGVSK